MQQEITADGSVQFARPVHIETITYIEADDAPVHSVKIIDGTHFVVFEAHDSQRWDYSRGGKAHTDILPRWHGAYHIEGLQPGDRLVIDYRLTAQPERAMSPEEIEVEQQKAAAQISIRKSKALSDSGNRIVRLQPSLDPYEGESIPS